MNLYNLLMGRNPQSDLLLSVIGLQESDIERFRDVFVSDDFKEIHVYTRTGGYSNRENYPNLFMRHSPYWISSEDDDYDCTYCTDVFRVPDEVFELLKKALLLIQAEKDEAQSDTATE